jgi:hypothetical protein
VVALTSEQRRAGESREEVKTGQRGHERRQNGAWFLWPRHVGWRAATDGGRFSTAQRGEHGHRLVTGSVAGDAGPVTRPGRQKEMGRSQVGPAQFKFSSNIQTQQKFLNSNFAWC